MHAVDSGQVHSRHPVQLALGIETGRVLLIALFAIGSRRLTVAVVFEPLQLGFNLPVALGNLILIEPVQFQGLGQLEDVFLPPVPPQGPGDRRLVGLDPGVAQLRQLPGVPFTIHDGCDDVHARLAGDVADDVVELHVQRWTIHALCSSFRLVPTSFGIARLTTQSAKHERLAVEFA